MGQIAYNWQEDVSLKVVETKTNAHRIVDELHSATLKQAIQYLLHRHEKIEHIIPTWYNHGMIETAVIITSVPD